MMFNWAKANQKKLRRVVHWDCGCCSNDSSDPKQIGQRIISSHFQVVQGHEDQHAEVIAIAREMAPVMSSSLTGNADGLRYKKALYQPDFLRSARLVTLS